LKYKNFDKTNDKPRPLGWGGGQNLMCKPLNAFVGSTGRKNLQDGEEVGNIPTTTPATVPMTC